MGAIGNPNRRQFACPVQLGQHDRVAPIGLDPVAGRPLQETTLNSLSYRPQTQLRLRNLVFNNPHIMTVLAEDGADELAIADYDSLAASQVIPRLPALSADELEAVRAYEAEHRGRKTVLTKISQLQSA